jgi:hypothetical protein
MILSTILLFIHENVGWVNLNEKQICVSVLSTFSCSIDCVDEQQCLAKWRIVAGSVSALQCSLFYCSCSLNSIVVCVV